MLFYTIYMKYILYLCTRFNRLRTAEQKGHKAYSRISVIYSYVLWSRNHLIYKYLTRTHETARGKESITIPQVFKVYIYSSDIRESDLSWPFPYKISKIQAFLQ